MNNPSPLIPQGSLQEQKNKGRARVKIAVFVVLAIHGLGLMALLIQGCQPKQTTPEVPVETNAPPAMDMTNLPPIETNPPPPAVTNPPSVEMPTPAVPSMPLAGATTYTIAKGDTLGAIARKFGTTVKAITDANPGVQPTKLQVGQKLQIPAGTATGGAAATTPAPNGTATSQTYTVKSGDTLTRIASHFGVSLKALRSANNLKTDSIKVGQVLKIPAKTSAPAPAASTVPEPAAPGAASAPTTPPSGQ